MCHILILRPDFTFDLPIERNTFGAGIGWLARWTGLEPATPGVTGRYSNQLSYHR